MIASYARKAAIAAVVFAASLIASGAVIGASGDPEVSLPQREAGNNAAAVGISIERYKAAQARCRAKAPDESICDSLNADDVLRSEAVWRSRDVSAGDVYDVQRVFAERCTWGDYPTFHAQIECADKNAHSGAALQLFDRLAAKVETDMQPRRLTDYDARVNLNQLLSRAQRNLNKGWPADAEGGDDTPRQPAAADERQEAREQAAEQERDQSRREAMRRAQEQADAEAQDAARSCIHEARARQAALRSSDNAWSRNYAAGMDLGRAFGGSIEKACAADPDWYTTIPLPPPPAIVTKCQSDLMGGYTCTTR